MRKRGAGFFFYLEYVWLPLLVLAGLGMAWWRIGPDGISDIGFATLVVGWLISFLVIGIWAIFLPLAYLAAIPVLWCFAAMVLGITFGNLAGIALELWRRRKGA
jgi:hypothetical protein